MSIEVIIGVAISTLIAVSAWFGVLRPRARPPVAPVAPVAPPKPNLRPIHEAQAREEGRAAVADGEATEVKEAVEDALSGEHSSMADVFNRDHGEA